MSIREIRYKIGIDYISPKTAQRVGMQNEHNATSVVFEFDSTLKNKLKNSVGVSEKLTYRFDIYNEADERFPSEESVLNIETTSEIELDLEQYMTVAGGKIRIYVVISKLSSNNKPLIVLYTPSAILLLEDLPSGVIGEKKEAVELNALIEQASEYAEQARLRADQASDAAYYAKCDREATEFAKEKAEENATLAQTAASYVSGLVSDAESYASSAKKSAESASGSVSDAESYASSAKISAESASGSVSDAESYASSAKISAQDALDAYNNTVKYINEYILGGEW